MRLGPVTKPLPENAVRRTVYVPVYSSIYLGLDIKQATVDLAATISVRNVSWRYPIVLEFPVLRFGGKADQGYVSAPSELSALATVEFVVQEADMWVGQERIS